VAESATKAMMMIANPRIRQNIVQDSVGNMKRLRTAGHMIRGPGKDLAMFRPLSILALGALCLLPGRASADTLKPHESVVSEISSRQRCACSTWRRPTRVVHYKRYRTAYLIGYDPLPYRFGSATVWAPPYRYYWR
jgi:hypothetical protein